MTYAGRAAKVQRLLKTVKVAIYAYVRMADDGTRKAMNATTPAAKTDEPQPKNNGSRPKR